MALKSSNHIMVNMSQCNRLFGAKIPRIKYLDFSAN